MGSDPEEFFVYVWAAGCVIGGLVCLLIGARAVGLALLGSLLGVVVGFFVVSFDLDALPLGAVTGATIGAILAGLAGLAWKPRASRSVLMALGVIVVLAGIGGATYVAAGGYGAVACRSYRAGCFPHVDGWAIALFALDAAWVAFLCFFQAAQATRADQQEALA